MFIKHDGKSIPLPLNVNVTIKHRSGLEHNWHVSPHDRWIWDKKKFAGDIVGYIVRDKA